MIIETWFPVRKDSDGFPKSRDWEALRCEVDDAQSEIGQLQSIPFYLKEVAYGDWVRMKMTSGGHLEFDRVERRGGYSVYRILLLDDTRTDEVQKALLHFGVLLERDRNLNLFAIAVPPNIDSNPLHNYLDSAERLGLLSTQDGYVAD